jgi:deoxyadenosine/deoxycytidine kinase
METKIDFLVIDQFFAAQMSANESKERLDALRPQAEEAVRELIKQQGKPADFTGIIEYNGFKIRVQRPKSYTWELNTQIKDENLDYYKRLHGYYEQLQENVKEARADLKRAAEKLAKSYPNSESIKRGFTVAVME